MLKTIFKLLAISIFTLLLIKCDNYEFPKSAYPKIETLPVVYISEGITFQANIARLGEKEIKDHGFVWGLYLNPTINNSQDKIQLGSISELGDFEATVQSEFSEEKIYYVRAFIATDKYFVYGENQVFVGL